MRDFYGENCTKKSKTSLIVNTENPVPRDKNPSAAVSGTTADGDRSVNKYQREPLVARGNPEYVNGILHGTDTSRTIPREATGGRYCIYNHPPYPQH